MRGYMIKRLLALSLVFMLVLSMTPVSSLAADVNDYGVLFTNSNPSTVYDGPSLTRNIRAKEDTLIQSISTYHWNGGRGKAPGSISIYTADNKLLGTWKATGRPGYMDVPNAYWDIFPNILVETGTIFHIQTSDNASWSYNSESGDCGIIEVRGRTATQSDYLGEPPDVPEENYRCSDWAKKEITKAEELGLIPDSLLTTDLTRPVNRAEFAAISVKAYEYMSGKKATAGSDPFMDTSDEDILKAYNLGITNGTSATKFSPTGLLNREQAATMLTRAYKKVVLAGWTLALDSKFSLDYKKPAAFADDQLISAYAKNSVYFMAANGIIKGVGGNKFAPKNTTSAQEASRYANATREQAIIIASRMSQGLDTAQKPPTDTTPGQTVAASGTVVVDTLSMSFESGRGDVKVSGDNTALSADLISQPYKLEFSNAPSGKTHVTLDVPNFTETAGDRAVIQVGVQVTTEDGNTGTVYKYYDTTLSGGKAAATIDFSELGELKNYAGGAVPIKTVLGSLLRISAVRRHVSGNSEFEVWWYSDENDPNQFQRDDAQRLVSDMSQMYAAYKDSYGFNDITRTQWEVKVYLADIPADGYYVHSKWGVNDGYFEFDQKNVTFGEGYKRAWEGRMAAGNVARDLENFSIAAHEMFHFIQSNYCYGGFGGIGAKDSLWFSEATASYYEYLLSGKFSSLARNTAPYMYDGVLPKTNDAISGYGRLTLIKFLQGYDPNFVLTAYRTGEVSGIDWHEFVKTRTGMDIPELARKFYTDLVFEDYVLPKTPESDPYEMYHDWLTGKDASRYKEYVKSIEFDARTTTAETVSVSVPAYGARFIRIDPRYLPANTKTVSVQINNSDSFTAKIISMKGKEMYSTEELSGGRIDLFLWKCMSYNLLMLINTTGSTQNTTATVTVNKDAGTPVTDVNDISACFTGNHSAEQIRRSSSADGQTWVVQDGTGSINLSGDLSTLDYRITKGSYYYSGNFGSAVNQSAAYLSDSDAYIGTSAASMYVHYEPGDFDGAASNPFGEIIKAYGEIVVVEYNPLTGELQSYSHTGVSPFNIN